MIIRREALEAALPATTTDDKSRYFLNAINIQPDGAVEATDGLIAFRIRDTEPTPDADFPTVAGAPFVATPTTATMVSREDVKKLLKVMPKRTLPILAAVQITTNGKDGTLVSATDLDSHTTVHGVDNAQFPILDRVLPSADRPHLTLMLAADVLQQIVTAALKLQGSSRRAAIIQFDIPTLPESQGRQKNEKDGTKGEPDGVIAVPVRITVKGSSLMLEGAVMPCRV